MHGRPAMKLLLVSALLLVGNGPRIDKNPAPYVMTEKVPLFVPMEQGGKQWAVRMVKVPAQGEALAYACFGRPNDRQVSCFYMVGNQAVVVSVTLEGENV